MDDEQIAIVVGGLFSFSENLKCSIEKLLNQFFRQF